MSRTESEVNETLDPPSSIWPSLLPPLRTPQQPCFQRVGPVPNIPTESAEPWPVALCQRRSSAGTIQDFQRRVPVSTNDDIEPYIARLAAGETNVLTHENVLLLEPTSGTTSGKKLIPYTKSLRAQFQRGIAAWIADLFQHRPAACRGRAYWSISPALGPRRVPAAQHQRDVTVRNAFGRVAIEQHACDPTIARWLIAMAPISSPTIRTESPAASRWRWKSAWSSKTPRPAT